MFGFDDMGKCDGQVWSQHCSIKSLKLIMLGGENATTKVYFIFLAKENDHYPKKYDRIGT